MDKLLRPREAADRLACATSTVYKLISIGMIPAIKIPAIDGKGKVKLKQAVNLTAAGAVSGGFWGLLIGTLFFVPLFGAAVGASTGAISGALRDIGVDDDFMRELGASLLAGTSALFVLVRQVTPDKVLDEIAPYGGKVLRTSLTKDKEAELQEVLSRRGIKQKGFEVGNG